MLSFAPIQKNYPNTQMLNAIPFVGFQDDVLSAEECEYIIELALGKTQRAKVSLDKESEIIPGRSGSNCWISYASDEKVKRIGERIAQIVGIPLENAEAMQVIHYGPEQEYRSHYDAYNLANERGQRCCRYGGQRLVTALVYLNDVEQGGGTRFDKLNTAIEAKRGRMALFNNVDEDYNRPHPNSLHAGDAVIKGEKWAFNIWFHARPMKEKQDFEQYTSLRKSTPPISESPLMPIIANRARDIFKQAINQLDPVLIKQAHPACFTYWDTYGHSAPDLSDIDDKTAVFKLIERRITNPLANKGQLAQLLQTHQLEHLAPKTFFNVEQAIAYDAPDSSLWFIKHIFGTGGKDMRCLRKKDLKTIALEKDQIIQEGVTQLSLLNGRKFTVRIYCFIWNQKIYLYKNGFLVVHGADFDPNSTDYKVQIDHTGYHKSDGQVKLVPLINYADYNRYYPLIKELVSNLQPILESTRHASSPLDYTMLGMDVLLREDDSVRLLEINTVPNFIHSREIIERVNIPFFKAAISAMLGDSSIVFEQIC